MKQNRTSGGADPSAAAACLRRHSGLRPTLAIVLGSGFSGVTTEIAVDFELPYSRIPGMPQPGVRGHVGRVLLGLLRGTPVLVLQGRAHYYEGYSPGEVTFPIRVLAEFGIQSVLLTNAAGGINAAFRPGDFMRVTDHLNFTGLSPLHGPGEDGKTRFVDLTCAYDPVLNQLLVRAGRTARLRLREGIYVAVAGPNYETPAECRAFGKLGADAVGMSTVLEVIVARHCGLAVAALSCITNRAACHTKRPLSHAEVLAVGHKSKERAARLLGSFAQLYGKFAENNGTT